MKKTKSKILSVLIVSFILALGLRVFVIEGYVVRGDSMEPSIHNGEYVLINKLAYYRHEPNRGDVLVAAPRTYPDPIIKRVAGLPGDLTDPARVGQVAGRDTGAKLAKGEYFLIGDNKDVSIDSREMGPVDIWDIRGKVFLIINLQTLKYRAM